MPREDTPIYRALAADLARTAGGPRHRLDPSHADYRDYPHPAAQEAPPMTFARHYHHRADYTVHAAGTSYAPRDVARVYAGALLDQASGKNIKIGYIELGGQVLASDLKAAGLPASVRVVAIGTQTPDPQGADGEVALDVQVGAWIAPDAEHRVYFAPNTDQGFIHAIDQAAADGCDVVSVSWGQAESQWSPQSAKAMAAAITDARNKGVTVTVAAGDTGSRDSTRSDVTDVPAACPDALGCGGTRLTANAQHQRVAEVVWNDNPTQSATGGGVSKVWPGRSVPDVAGDADPQTGYQIVVGGRWQVIGGTSAVAPLYAGLIALVLEARKGSRFDVANAIATNPTVCFDVCQGDNGGFRAGPGRDSVSGYGVVDWSALAKIVTSGTQVPAPGGDPTQGGSTGGGTTTPTPVSATQALAQIEAIAKSVLGA